MNLLVHFSQRHGEGRAISPERSFEGLNRHLAENCDEGIVFHHPDGRMAKIKRRDFGLRWPISTR